MDLLVAAFDDKHNLLLGAKPDFYPPGIVRLLGGGVDEGENIKDAACRELLEETGVAVHKDKIHIKTKFSIRAIDCDGNAYNNDTYLVCANIESTPVNPGDDVKQIIKYKSQDLDVRPFIVSDNSEIIVKLLKKGKSAVFVMDGQKKRRS